jgi:hypothetical protein
MATLAGEIRTLSDLPIMGLYSEVGPFLRTHQVTNDIRHFFRALYLPNTAILQTKYLHEGQSHTLQIISSVYIIVGWKMG